MVRRSMWLGILVAGCGPVRVGGSIDGEGVGGARDAIWDTFSLQLGPIAYEVTTVVLTDFPDACETYDQFLGTALTEFGCNDACDAYGELVRERGLMKDRYWATTLVVNTSDGKAGTFDLDGELEAGEFSASFDEYDTAPLHDPTTCEEVCEDGDLLVTDAEAGEGGDLELETDEDLLIGRFSVAFGGNDRLDGRFVAHPCDMGGWFLDL